MNNIIDLVTATLSAKFPLITIYDEVVQQNLVEPAFIVLLVEGTHTQEIGNRYRQEHDLCIHYLSDKTEQELNTDLIAMADKLNEALELVEYDKEILSGYKMRHEIDDGVLHFFVTVRRMVKHPEKCVEMKTMEIKEGVK